MSASRQSVISSRAHWLITGGTGLLGNELCRRLVARGYRVTAIGRAHDSDVPGVATLHVDLLDLPAVQTVLDRERPDVVIHAAGMTNVDACEVDEPAAERLHAEAAGVCAGWAARYGARVVYVSTDHLWDGSKPLVTEDTPPSPVNAYARTKLAGEQLSLAAHPQALVLRTNFFGPGRAWRRSFSDWVLDALRDGRAIDAFQDVFFTPIASPLLCDLMIDMVEAGAAGVYHLAGGERVSKFDFARRLALATGHDPALVHPASIADAQLAARRPTDMSLSTERAAALLGRPLPALGESFASLSEVAAVGGPVAGGAAGTTASPQTGGYGRQTLDDADEAAVLNVLRGAYLTQGPAVPAFEEALAELVGARYAVAVSSGTAALHLACLCAGLGPGTRAVTQGLTFVASANSMLYCGARADLLDVDADDLIMSSDGLARHLDAHPETRAVMPVLFGGLAARSADLRRIAGDRLLIEDGSHALGGQYEDGAFIGSGAHADMTIFSFHPVKPITTAEGGAVVTNDEELCRTLRMLRNHGIERGVVGWERPEEAFEDGAPRPWYYEQQALGFNYRMSDLQAALGSSQLTKLPRFLQRRRDIAKRYDAAFAGLPHLRLVQAAPDQRARSGHHLYVLRIDFPALGLTRKQVMERLRQQGVGSQVHYIPVYRQPYHARQGVPGTEAFPQTEAYYAEAISIPFHPALTDGDVDHVIAVFSALVGA